MLILQDGPTSIKNPLCSVICKDDIVASGFGVQFMVPAMTIANVSSRQILVSRNGKVFLK